LAAEDYYYDGPSFYSGDLIILRYNNNGEQLWRINMEGFDLHNSVITVDSKLNLYLASMYRNHTIVENMILFKFNCSGELIWQTTWNGGDNGKVADIEVDSKDNIFIYGRSDLAEDFKFDLFITKYNSTGSQQWFYLYGEIESDFEGWDMEIDSKSNIIVSGYGFLQGDFSYWIRSYNQSGILNWALINDQRGYYRLVVDSLDNIIVLQKSVIIKYDNVGNLIWSWQHYIEFYWSINIVLDSYDNIYLGSTISIPSDHHTYDLYVMKINSSGIFDWYLTWGGSDDEDLVAIDTDSNNTIYLLSDHFLIKNPKSNGKSLTAENLWNFYIILFFICFIISLSSLYLILRRKNKQASTN
jgi:hypothetical protein